MDKLIRSGIRALIATEGQYLTRDELLQLASNCKKWATAKEFELYFVGLLEPIRLDASSGLTLEQHLEPMLEQIADKSYPASQHYFETWFSALYRWDQPIRFLATWAVKTQPSWFRDPTTNRPVSEAMSPRTEVYSDYMPKARDTILIVSNT